MVLVVEAVEASAMVVNVVVLLAAVVASAMVVDAVVVRAIVVTWWWMRWSCRWLWWHQR